MLDSTVELLVGLCLIALPLMISFCIVGSIVAALRAVSRKRAAVNIMRTEGITMARGERKNQRKLGNAAPGSERSRSLAEDGSGPRPAQLSGGQLHKRIFPTRAS
jgi:hypothetical protein